MWTIFRAPILKERDAEIQVDSHGRGAASRPGALDPEAFFKVKPAQSTSARWPRSRRSWWMTRRRRTPRIPPSPTNLS